MRVIKKRALNQFCAAHPQGKEALLRWFQTIRKCRWKNFNEMRTTFPHADEVKVQSGKKAVIFNIKKNAFRLITAVHYEKTLKDAQGKVKLVEGKVYLFYFLTHAEYDKEAWKGHL